MSVTLTPEREKVVERVRGELVAGTTFHFKEQGSRGADLMRCRAPITSRTYGAVVQVMGRFASGGDRDAATASAALAKMNLYGTPEQLLAGIAAALGKVVREGYYDVVGATGPEASRPSAHQHATTLREAVRLEFLYAEVEHAMSESAANIGHLPGVGWALQAIAEAEGITPSAYQFPRVAKAWAA